MLTGIDPATLVSMHSTSLPSIPSVRPVARERTRSPARGAFEILHWGFVALPVLAGLEKTTVSHAKATYTPPADVLATVDRFEKQGVAKARERAAGKVE